MMKAPVRILIVAALAIAGLIALVVRENAARASGTEILMAMEAVDPRALLAGHYVVIQLQERLPEGEPCPAGIDEYVDFGPDRSWVALAERDGTHHAVAVKMSREEAAAHAPLVAKGGANCFMQTRWVEPPPVDATGAEPAPEPPQQAVVSANLGVERFYIGQAEAERIERVLRDQEPGEGRAFAIISIGADGVARLKGLVIDGERIETKLF
jgi:hypothetical protein